MAIRLGGLKSTSEHHGDAVALLSEVTAAGPERDDALRHLRRLIDEKTRIAYTGEALTAAKVESLAKPAERFRRWAHGLLGS